MKSSRPLFLSLAAALALVPAALAAELGEAAPPLQIATWAKGQPVDLAALKGKKTVVVEFWATWCGPCLQSIPHLTEMQKRFKDVVFVGVTDEDADTVKKFVAKMGDKMDYTVAVDKEEKTAAAYMKAFGLNGIPHAFVVSKDGLIIWHGHPMAGLDDVLEEIQAGKYNLQKAKKMGLLDAKVQQFAELVTEDEKDPGLDKLSAEIAALEKEIGDIAPERKFDPAAMRKQVRFRKALRAYQRALADGKSEAELGKITAEIEATAPKEFKLVDFKEAMEAQTIFGQYYRAAVSGADKETLDGLAKKVAAIKTRNVRLLNDMAWAILADEKIQVRDYDLAIKLANAAVDASGEKEPAALDTFARAWFDSGKAAEAVIWQKKAIAVAKDEEMRKELEVTLKKYQQKAGK